MNGICLGFYEDSRDGHRIIGHDGDTIYFHSRLRLIPDAGVGFFLSFNSAGLGISNDREQIFQKFVDRYFPFTPPNPPAISTAVADAKTLSGSYLNTRRSESNFLAVLNVISPLSVSALPGGDLQVSGIDGFNHQPLKFREVRPTFTTMSAGNRTFRSSRIRTKRAACCSSRTFLFSFSSGFRGTAAQPSARRFSFSPWASCCWR